MLQCNSVKLLSDYVKIICLLLRFAYISDEDLRSFTLKGEVKGRTLTYQVAAKIHQSPMYEILKKEASVAK